MLIYVLHILFWAQILYLCPMCGLGACGCVSFATETLIAAWRDAAATKSEPPGFLLPKRSAPLRKTPGTEFSAG
jgi:hypothetical protein